MLCILGGGSEKRWPFTAPGEAHFDATVASGAPESLLAADHQRVQCRGARGRRLLCGRRPRRARRWCQRSVDAP